MTNWIKAAACGTGLCITVFTAFGLFCGFAETIHSLLVDCIVIPPFIVAFSIIFKMEVFHD